MDQRESSGAQPSAQLERSSGALLGFACASPGIISRYLTSINHLLTISYKRLAWTGGHEVAGSSPVAPTFVR